MTELRAHVVPFAVLVPSRLWLEDCLLVIPEGTTEVEGNGRKDELVLDWFTMVIGIVKVQVQWDMHLESTIGVEEG